jgi:hypothetical protein
MPDSLTKFEEDAVEKSTDGSSTTSTTDDSSSDSSDSSSDTSCTDGSDALCTNPGNFTYGVTEITGTLPETTSLSVESYDPTWDTELTGHDDYITYTADTNMLAIFGTVNTENGQFGGEVSSFTPQTTVTMTADYDSADYFTSAEVPAVTASVNVTFAHDLQAGDVIYPQIEDQQLILTVNDVSNFNAGDSVSDPDGAVALIDYVDSSNNELHITIQAASTNAFEVNESIDNQATFFSSKATINSSTAVYNAFDTDDAENVFSFNGADFVPLVTNVYFSDDEKRSIQYSINPALPTGLNLNQFTGALGTDYAEQIISGTVSALTGERTLIGTNTAFTTELAVGSIITIDGQSAVVRSITSDTELEIYTPLSADIISKSIFRRIADSVDISGTTVSGTNNMDFTASPAVLTGSDHNIWVNGSDTFTYPTTVAVGTLTLAAVSAVTSATLQDLTPTEYTISAKNLLGNSIDTTLYMGILGNPSPKTISTIAYDQEDEDSQKLKLTVADSSAFTVGDKLSNAAGAVATVTYINSATEIYAEMDGASTNDIVFTAGDSIDNADPFFSAETTIATSGIVYTFPVDTVIGLNATTNSNKGLYPIIDPTQTALGDDEESTLEFSITPASDDSNNDYVDINNGLYMYKHSVCVDTADNFPTCDANNFCINGFSTETNKTDCAGAGHDWVYGGTIFGTPTDVTSDLTYTITVTNTLGRTATTDITMAFQRAPKGLSLTRNVLLHVPSASAFNVGDAITTDNGAEGTVINTITRGNTKADTTLYEWDLIEVKVLHGEFSEYDDLDNHPTYASQETYILGDGIYHYNTKLTVADSSNFVDPLYTGYDIDENELDVGGTVKGNVIYNDEANNVLYVQAHNNAVAAGTPGDPSSTKIIDSLKTATTINQSNIAAGAQSTTITSLESTNIYVETGSDQTYSAGLNVTTSGTGIAVINRPDLTTPANFFANVASGLFGDGETIELVNPYTGVAETIADVSHEHSFYLYKNEQAFIKLNLDNGNTDTSYTLDKDLPTGLTLDTNDTSNIFISGTPTAVASIETFTITATNPFGSIDYTFNLKVHDHFSIDIRSDVSTASYILHREGKGHGRSACRITQDQIDFNSGTDMVNDMVCYLEAGDTELFEKGVELTVAFGDGMCEFIVETPYLGFIAPTGTTADDIYYHSGESAECGVTEATSQDAAGTVASVSNGELCLYNNTYGGVDYNCDDGAITEHNITWDEYDFECYDNTGTLDSSITTATACIYAKGSCNNINGTSDNYPDCSAAADTWTYDGSHNDASLVGSTVNAGDISNTDAQLEDDGGLTAMGTCTSTDSTSTYTCGGEAGNCAVGHGADEISAEDITAGIRSNITTMTGLTSKDITINSPRSKGYASNISIANFVDDNNNTQNDCTTDNYTFDATNYLAYTGGASNWYTNGTTSYVYQCRNAAGTVIARFFLMIRDWDKEFRVSDNIDQVYPGSPMDDAGTDGFGAAYNYANDLDDYYNAGGFCADNDGDFNFDGGGSLFPLDRL